MESRPEAPAGNRVDRAPDGEVPTPSGSTESTRPRGRLRSAVIPVVVLSAVTLTAWLNLISVARRYTVDVLFRDMWIYYAPFFDGRGYGQAFLRQHGPHRMGIGLIYDGIVMQTTGWNARVLAVAVTVVLLAASVVHLIALWRGVGKLEFVDAVIPIWILSERLAEHVVVWPSTSHSIFGLLMLGVMALALTARREAIRWGVVCAVIPLATFTGFGLFIGLATLVVLIAERLRSRWELVHFATLGVIFLSYAAYLWNFKWDHVVKRGGTRLLSPGGWWDNLQFGGYMFSSLLGIKQQALWVLSVGLVCLAGAIVLVVTLTAKVARQTTVRAERSVPLLFFVYSLLYAAGASAGQQPWFRVNGAFQARYLAGLAPAVIGVWWLFRSSISKQETRTRFALVGIAILLAVPAVRVPERPWLAQTCQTKRGWVESYLETGSVADANKASPPGVLSGQSDERDTYRKLLERRLSYLEEHNLSFFRSKDRAVTEVSC